MTDKVRVHEVGLRDGLQLHSSFVQTNDKLKLIQASLAAGVSSIEATSFVPPHTVPQLADADALFPKLPDAGNISYMALIPNKRGYERAVSVGTKSIAVVLATAETFNHNLLGMSLDRAQEVCTSVIGQAKDDGMFARAYLSGAYVCPYDGPISPEVIFDLSARMFDAGVDEAATSDTIGGGKPSSHQISFLSVAADITGVRLGGKSSAWFNSKDSHENNKG